MTGLLWAIAIIIAETISGIPVSIAPVIPRAVADFVTLRVSTFAVIINVE